jgi:O-methyltransferase involved in polyketide biosynthesis
MPQPPPPSRRRPALQRTAQAAPVHQREDGDTDQPCLLERAQLHAVPSTLLIPLAARAHGGRYFAWLACQDAVATQLLAELGADINAYLDDLPTVLNVLWRTRAIKQAGQAFFAAHPQALGVNLGCGLTHHFQWLDTGANQWLDADLPEVMALREQLLPLHCPRARHARVDLSQPGWWKRLGLPKKTDAQPVLLVCEGVLMYLQPEQVHAVLAEFAQSAPPGSRMVLDVLTRQAVGRASTHASVGPTGAEFHWGVGRMAELEQVHPRLQLLREQSVSECYGWTGIAMDMLWRPWLGAPLYGMATLGVKDGVP